MKLTGLKDISRERLEAIVAERTAQVEAIRAKREAANAAWRKSGYRDDEAYHRFDKADDDFRSAERELEFFREHLEPKLYANQKFYTDWHPWEVIEDHFTYLVIRKMAGTDEKSFRSLPDYPTEVVKLHSNLIYYFPGENVRDPGCTFHLSTSPHYYYDMEF